MTSIGYVPGVQNFPGFPTLSDILIKTRRLTGTANDLQLTDAQICNYINSFYNYDLPAKFRSLKLKDKYTFNTINGIDTYAFDSEHYVTVSMPCYCAKREVALFTDPWSFYGVNFNWQFQDQFLSGDGSNGPYDGTLSDVPIVRSVNNDPGTYASPNLFYPQSRNQNILITANLGYGITANVTDDGNGNLIQIFNLDPNNLQSKYGPRYVRCYAAADPDVPTATINYETGAISGLYFWQIDNASPPNFSVGNVPGGNAITAQYNSFTQAIPQSILFFQNQFILRPIPDKGYTIELMAYRQPIQALMAEGEAGNPELSEWWELLAVGAAKKIYEDRLDFDGVQLMDKMIRERYSVVETRTYAQIGQQRVSSIFADQLQYNYGASAGWNGGI